MEGKEIELIHSQLRRLVGSFFLKSKFHRKPTCENGLHVNFSSKTDVLSLYELLEHVNFFLLIDKI